ncbi:MAG: tetratricopeptide repeat protein [Planctomycetota bacterium]
MRSHGALLGAAFIVALLLGRALLAEESGNDLTKSLVNAWLGTARDRFAHGEWEPAERAFRQVLIAEPANEEAIAGLGLSLVGQEELDEADRVLADGIARAPQSARIRFAMGRVALGRADGAAAQAHFEALEKLDPKWPSLHYWLGMAHLRQRNGKDALAHLQAETSADPKVKEAVKLAEGMALIQMGQPDEARKRFEDLRAEAPGTPLAELAVGLEGRGVPEDRRLHLTVRLGERYDDNASLVPTEGLFGLTDQSYRTFGNTFEAGASYDLVRDQDLLIDAGYDFYDVLNYSNRNTDIQGHTAHVRGAWLGHLGGHTTKFDLGSWYTYTFVHQESFQQRVSTIPSYSLALADWTTTTLAAGHVWSDFLEQKHADGTDRDRDAHDALVGVSQAFRLPFGGIQLQVGYQYNRAWAEGDDYDHDAHRARWGVLWPVPWQGLLLRVNGEHVFRDYDHVDSLAGESREDDEFVLRTGLTYPIGDSCDVSFIYSRDRNVSTLDINDFERNTYDLAVEFRF